MYFRDQACYHRLIASAIVLKVDSIRLLQDVEDIEVAYERGDHVGVGADGWTAVVESWEDVADHINNLRAALYSLITPPAALGEDAGDKPDPSVANPCSPES